MRTEKLASLSLALVAALGVPSPRASGRPSTSPRSGRAAAEGQRAHRRGHESASERAGEPTTRPRRPPRTSRPRPTRRPTRPRRPPWRSARTRAPRSRRTSATSTSASRRRARSRRRRPLGNRSTCSSSAWKDLEAKSAELKAKVDTNLAVPSEALKERTDALRQEITAVEKSIDDLESHRLSACALRLRTRPRTQGDNDRSFTNLTVATSLALASLLAVTGCEKSVEQQEGGPSSSSRRPTSAPPRPTPRRTRRPARRTPRPRRSRPRSRPS